MRGLKSQEITEIFRGLIRTDANEDQQEMAVHDQGNNK